MRIRIVTLFPEFFGEAPVSPVLAPAGSGRAGSPEAAPSGAGSPGAGPLGAGLMGRARAAGILSLSLHNPRENAHDRHRTVDDRPYGGGPGMVLMAEPLAALLRDLGVRERGRLPSGRLIYLSPKGRPLTQELARELAGENELTLICGRYEGLDARLEEIFPVEAVSVGDVVLNGGEAAALCLVEAVARLLPGFMGHEESGDEESFSRGLLEYPHYTRPERFEGREVPRVLLSGDHAAIGRWRRRASLLHTLAHRPDLLDEAPLTPDDRAFLRACRRDRPGRNLSLCLVHAPVLDKEKNSVTVSLTNLDIHDIARSSCTYGLARFFVATPLDDQRELLRTLVRHWTEGAGGRSNPDRREALRLVQAVRSVEEAIAAVTAASGQPPLVIGSSADDGVFRAASPPETERSGGPAARIENNATAMPLMEFSRIRRTLALQPVLLLLGTGHGLSPLLRPLCAAFAPPVRALGPYNHLSVRSAAAIILDRILRDWG